MMKHTSLVIVACSLGSAIAHFTLDYPQSRGFDEDIEVNFCGGFNQTTRTPYPLGNAPILIDSHHQSAQLAVLISLQQNPTTFAQFNNTAQNGTTVQYLLPFFNIQGEGEKCMFVDIGAAGLQGVSNGTNATLQVAYNGGDGALYQCADIVLTTTATVPGNVSSQCTSQDIAGPSISLAPSGALATAPSAQASATSSVRSAGKQLVAPGATFLGALLALIV